MSGTAVTIRDAVAGDAAAISAIYNDAVLTTTATWNATPETAEARAAAIAARQAAGHPVIVCTDAAGRVTGFGTYGPWRAWDGYRLTVEHSVYVDRAARGNGQGRALMETLIARARAAGMHVMVAGIGADNEGSIRLHRRMGFEDAGTVREVGAKFGRWLDLTFLALRLDDRPAPDR